MGASINPVSVVNSITNRRVICQAFMVWHGHARLLDRRQRFGVVAAPGSDGDQNKA